MVLHKSQQNEVEQKKKQFIATKLPRNSAQKLRNLNI